MPHEKLIDNEEWLYRSFPVPDMRQNGKIHYEIIDGVLRLSRGVWNDRSCMPSVDRKSLLSSAKEAKFNISDAVVQIQAQEIRSISGSIKSTENTSYDHDVIFNPTPERPAHAQIISSPRLADRPSSEKNKWDAFKTLLSLAAAKHGLIIEPEIS